MNTEPLLLGMRCWVCRLGPPTAAADWRFVPPPPTPPHPPQEFKDPASIEAAEQGWRLMVAASGKLTLLQQLLPRLLAGGHRVLLFSQSVEVGAAAATRACWGLQRQQRRSGPCRLPCNHQPRNHHPPRCVRLGQPMTSSESGLGVPQPCPTLSL